MPGTTQPAVTPAAATYASLFPEQLADRCSPDALESNSGPIAYLHALYQQALALEATSTSTERFTLGQRRPDIGELLLSQEALKKQIRPLTLAINALTRQAQSNAGANIDLPETISQAGIRAALPFHYPFAQIQAVLRHKKINLFELLQTSEYTYPNFCYGNLRTEELRQVMRTATGFSPALQTLLLDASATTDRDFLKLRFGVDGSNAGALTRLRGVALFCQKTGLKPEQVHDLLATSGVADNATTGFTSVKRSAAYPSVDGTALSGHLYGAAFINNGQAPALSLEDTRSGPGITLAIKGGTAAHFGRIHKIIHLQHALNLPFAEVDLLLMAALRAEGQTQNFRITENTLRALGVFRYFNESYGVTAEQFAALIHEVSPYAVGDQVPFLDRVLDGPGAGQLADVDDRLVIDDREFDPGEQAAEVDKKIIARLCRALGMGERLVRLHLTQTAAALGLSKPTLSLAVVSALYRQSRLHRLLRLPVDECASLVALLALGSTEVPKALSSATRITTEDETADILDVLVALSNTRQWLKRENLSATTLLPLLRPLTNVPKHLEPLYGIDASARIALKDELPRLRSALLSEAKIAEVVGSSVHLNEGDWLGTLDRFLTAQGVIKQPNSGVTDSLLTQLESVLDDKLGNEGQKEKVAQALATLIVNARVAQEDVAKYFIAAAFGGDAANRGLSTGHALPLLRWIDSSPTNLLADVLAAAGNDETMAEENDQPLKALSFSLWAPLTRHAQIIRVTQLSPAGLQAMLDHPQWFDFVDAVFEDSEADENVSTSTQETTVEAAVPASLNLDLLYQLMRFRDWIGICRAEGFEESDAIDYLSNVRPSDEPGAIDSAVTQLGKLIGWGKDETLLAVPYVSMTATKNQSNKSATFDDFLSSLTLDERRMYDQRGMSQLLRNYHGRRAGKAYRDERDEILLTQFTKFIQRNPGPLKVTKEQYDTAYQPKAWASYQRRSQQEGHELQNPVNLEMEVYIAEPATFIDVPCVPNNISDIDFVLRLQALSKHTELCCQSLLDLSLLDESATFEEFNSSSQVLIGTCGDEERALIEAALQPMWRDGLADYLMGYWVSANPNSQATITDEEDLSSYFLTDIWVSGEARETTLVTQAISSLQHYLYRLFSHLEPGYETSPLPASANSSWEKYLSKYGTWKEWRTQINHPENLIYYANRPNKTAAFEELEVEVNQGKLDSELLETAVLSYLNKFERLSNLQIVSGYLDGRDPKNDTYYLIGKTNASPSEYYLRSVDMGLRDDKQRLSPLAWTEWKKIDLTPTGQIVQSVFTEARDKTDENGEIVKKEGVSEKVTETSKCDAVRPVIIAGRPYVFWVERGTTGLPSADAKNQAITPYKRISVHYAYLQSDGFWSTANELMCLDGTVEGKRLPDANNKFLKDESYVPSLIVFVNVEGPRYADPWLTVILYNSAKENGIGKLNEDYFVEMRDLLLVEKKRLSEDAINRLANPVFKSYKDIKKVQHIYDGRPVPLIPEREEMDDDGPKSRIHLKMVQNKTKADTVQITVNVEQEINNLILSVITPDGVIQNLDVGRMDGFDAEYTYSKDGLYTFDIEVFRWEKRENMVVTKQYDFRFPAVETDELWDITIEKKENQAQYLDLSSVTELEPLLASNEVRLNTLFGKNLVARATQSVDTAISWGTQQLKEPTIDPVKPDPPVDFHGANGLYFRELFLHLPALIASRLTEQQQFEEAETWYLRYLFDPYRALPDHDGRPAYWNTRPLAEVGTLTSELNRQVDPVARAFILSRYYRQAVFLNVVENWQKQGDHYYRQLTLSTLNHAWLCYQQALKLIGPLPERAAVSRWSPVELASVTENSFRTPINKRVIEARKILESRLYNLRHGLTLDGKALPNLGWGDEGGDPFASAKGGLSIVPTSYNSDRASIPAYRFRQVLPTARAAAQQLLDMGRHYMKLMEDEFNTTLSVLLKTQEIRISDFTLQLCKENINSITAKKRELELSLEAAEFRRNHWANLLEVGRSPREEAATALIWTAGVLKYAAIPAEIVAGGIDGVVPTILGLAVGGTRPAEITRMGSKAMSMSSTALSFFANQLQAESGYERRATGWTFDMRQAEWDIKLVGQQIQETNVELNASIISLQQAKQERANLEEAYVAMTTGFTIIPIYNWLVARQELLYGAAYDAVLSLCLSLESAWRFEIGDYKREAFIKTSAWSDSYKGMLAGESLLVDLQEMENAYLLANERRLTIKKSFSLKKLLGESWESSIKALPESNALAFGLRASDFDKNYPGHYLRQLKHVSVSLVLNANKSLDEVAAILTQTANTTLIEPNEDGIDYLKNGGEKIPPSIKRNLRAQQQIALSSQVQEDGLGYSPGEWVYELMFHDGRYLPFEGTGAISEWQLHIPDADIAKSLKDAVEDIRINLVYTALPGNSTLVKKT